MVIFDVLTYMMKTTKLLLIMLLPVMVLLSGCPIGLDYPAGNVGTEKIDKKLLGTWTTNKEDPEFGKVTIAKSTANSYSITVENTGTMYSLETNEFTGWVTEIGGKTFIYALPNGENSYFMYCYKFSDGKMYTYDVGLLDGGTEAVKSIESLRTQIETSLKREDCLSDEIEWTKQ